MEKNVTRRGKTGRATDVSTLPPGNYIREGAWWQLLGLFRGVDNDYVDSLKAVFQTRKFIEKLWQKYSIQTSTIHTNRNSGPSPTSRKSDNRIKKKNALTRAPSEECGEVTANSTNSSKVLRGPRWRDALQVEAAGNEEAQEH